MVSTIYVMYVVSLIVLYVALSVSLVVASGGVLCSALASLLRAMTEQRRLDRWADRPPL